MSDFVRINHFVEEANNQINFIWFMTSRRQSDSTGQGACTCTSRKDLPKIENRIRPQSKYASRCVFDSTLKVFLGVAPLHPLCPMLVGYSLKSGYERFGLIDTHSWFSVNFLPYIRVRIPGPPPLFPKKQLVAE